MPSWNVGSWSITRVDDPGFELVLPQDEATVATLKTSPWLRPHWVTETWDLQVGSSAILLQRDELNVLVDPWLAFDDPDKFGPRLEALAGTGVTADDIDIVVNSHVDGIGANVVPGTDQPAFPNARYYLADAELAAVRAGRHPAATALATLDAMVPIFERYEIAPGLTLEPLPGHNDAHFGVAIGDEALLIGHLFLHPAQIANPDAPQPGDGDLVRQTRRDVLARCAAAGTLVIGPLFAVPGGGRVVADGDRWGLAL